MGSSSRLAGLQPQGSAGGSPGILGATQQRQGLRAAAFSSFRAGSCARQRCFFLIATVPFRRVVKAGWHAPVRCIGTGQSCHISRCQGPCTGEITTECRTKGPRQPPSDLLCFASLSLLPMWLVISESAERASVGGSRRPRGQMGRVRTCWAFYRVTGAVTCLDESLGKVDCFEFCYVSTLPSEHASNT